MIKRLQDIIKKISQHLRLNTRLINYYWQRTRRNKLAVAGLAFIIFLVALGIIGPLFTLDPTEVNFEERDMPPVYLPSEQFTYDIQTGQYTTKEIRGTWKHALGTDSKGRDMLAMLVSGARISLLVGLIATGIAIILGTIIGVLSAYLGGWADNALMRFTDVMMTFPFFLLLVLIVFIFGRSLAIIVLAIGLTGWTGAARLLRSESLSLRTREFIVATKALGASDNRVIFRHLIPNVISLIIVIATLSIPSVILAEAALSFIGLGDTTKTSWGIILESGQNTLETSPWVAVEPGIMIFLTVLAFNFLGDGLRDAFDPKSNI
ncbi:MAG: ABC transporter permease [Chloroflexota bacterium]|nr:MAG: ABC transporter permease [Chloroflexota bacterium]